MFQPSYRTPTLQIMSLMVLIAYAKRSTAANQNCPTRVMVGMRNFRFSVFIELGRSEMTCFLAKYMMPEAE